MSLPHQHFENMLHRQPLAIDFGFLFHRDIHPRHRNELLNWIYQLTQKFSDHDLELFFQTVAMVDLFCNRKDVSLQKYQLVGASAFWIASKNGLLQSPSARELVYLSMGSFAIQDLLSMEMNILSTIEWRVQVTTPFSILLMIFFPLMGQENRIASEFQFDDQFQVASQVLVLMQKDLNFVGQSPVLQGLAASTATFLCFEMSKQAQETLKLAESMGIEQDLMRSAIIELQPFFKGNLHFPEP